MLLKYFKVHTNAKNFQVGAFIIQNGRPIALYIRKLSYDQKRYTVTENELLNIIKTLKQSRIILNGQRLKIYTDDVNLAGTFFNTE